MFVKTSSGEPYNVLLSGEYGAWMISYDQPKMPVYVDSGAFEAYERIEPPAEYVAASSKKRSTAAESRYQLILPLLRDIRSITDAEFRNALIKQIAEESNTTVQRVRNLYFRYLATGRLLDDKPRKTSRKPEFDKAIRNYYFSAKRNSLRTTYELMLLDSYTDSNGVLREPVPSLDSFRMYYYRYWSKDPQKKISRDGLGNYRRNERPLYGSAMAFRTRIGSYAIDETPADLHVVSSMDRTKTIGRPNVYLAVDIATQMITGVYVGMDAGENALMACIANAVSSKVQFCADLGIVIDEADWPCVGMPSEIISDRGGEFCSDRMGELCLQYGVDLNVNEPFRPDLKSLVERNIGLIQESYRSMLEGNGVIGDDAYERWAVDYRKQAVLTIEEYRAIVVHCILALNSRTLENMGHLPFDAPNTPIKLWKWMQEGQRSTLLCIDSEDVYRRALPRLSAKLERKGIYHNKLRYVPEKPCGLQIGMKLTYAYDLEDCSRIFVLTDTNDFIPFKLATSCARYEDLSADDVSVLQEQEQLIRTEAAKAETAIKVQMRKNIRNIVEKAKCEKGRYI